MTNHGQMIEVSKPAKCRSRGAKCRSRGAKCRSRGAKCRSRGAKCRSRGADIAFQKSAKTGRFYPTDVMVADGALVTGKTWFHKCRTAPTPIKEAL